MIALTHAVDPALDACELTFVGRKTIDVERARRQHAHYRALLESLGADVVLADVSPGQPDAVFVEDTLVVLDEVAIAASMGAASRRAEVRNVLPLIARHREVVALDGPGTLEGGDVLRIDRTLFVGASTRTDAAGIAALRQIAAPLGYRVVAVPVTGCLHLKTACTALDARTLLANPDWVDPGSFAGMSVVAVDPAEPFAANSLRIGSAVCMSESNPSTIRRVRGAGFDVRTVDISELEKAEAGVTCLCVVFESASPSR